MKPLVIAFIVLVIVGGIIGWSLTRNSASDLTGNSTSTTGGTSTSTSSSTVNVVPADWQTYRNTAGGFSVRYPQIAQINDGAGVSSFGWSYNTASAGTTFAELVIPKSFEPNSNLSEAKFHVGASRGINAVADCLKADYQGQQVRTEVINGVTYTVFSGGDAGAGNFYDIESYRTLHAGQCYAVELVIHSTNIGNYDPSQNIHEFDKAKVSSLLHQMVNTFTFF